MTKKAALLRGLFIFSERAADRLSQLDWRF
jgi:hypothetical protein